MLPKVSIHRFPCAASIQQRRLREVVGDELIDEIDGLVQNLKGIRICNINSTAYGGGVAELLTRHVPFANALGLQMDWRLILGTPEFFTVSKAMHNALQGAPYELSPQDKDLYLHVNRESANLLDTSYDVFIVHDPQPAAFREAAGDLNAKWIWRCHIDTSAPNPRVAAFLLPYLQAYDALVFTMPEFLLPDLGNKSVAYIPPAIDAFSTKNMELPVDVCRDVVCNAGVNCHRPLLVQVSRFDPWKDPMGVIATYRLAKEAIPGLQLALLGSIAGDDPEGWQLLAQVNREASEDPDVFVLTNLAGVGNLEVNAFQRMADVVIQKSLREGFGLVVSEAFWKSKPVVAGRAGGIPMQFPPGYDRYLVNTVEEAAARTVELLRAPDARRRFGLAAHDHVKRRFLMPRLVRDELRLIRDVVQNRQTDRERTGEHYQSADVAP